MSKCSKCQNSLMQGSQDIPILFITVKPVYIAHSWCKLKCAMQTGVQCTEVPTKNQINLEKLTYGDF